EIELGLDEGIFCFNVESLQEMIVINEIAERKNIQAPIALRLNPNVQVNTHKYITTGLHENKFGISDEELLLVLDALPSLSHIQFLGIHFHIGSQITSLEPFVELCHKANQYVEQIEDRGFTIKVLNMGGGFGVNYSDPNAEPIPDLKAFFEVFDTHLNHRKDQEVHFELGRAIIAQAGSLLTRVLYIKERSTKNFAVVDAGMTELIRPALYQATHIIDALSLSDSNAPLVNYDVVGPICESSDTFIQDYPLNKLQRGDVLAIRSAGAYGQVMKSRYNLRPDFPVLYSDELSHPPTDIR
ncbi:diaminopimelate decarboxylase, partial [Balneolaceae bacterium]|nr:diaminopimelate decarboxylase [Balneolaceae bacterium]